jgi:hypothetical protein
VIQRKFSIIFYVPWHGRKGKEAKSDEMNVRGRRRLFAQTHRPTDRRRADFFFFFVRGAAGARLFSPMLPL